MEGGREGWRGGECCFVVVVFKGGTILGDGNEEGKEQ